MYKLNKNIAKATTLKQAEKDKLFATDVPLGQRLSEAWYLTCIAYNIDYKNPPKMVKKLTAIR